MNKEETNALFLLTGKESMNDVSVAELAELADRYPYFSAVQLLLCKKMQAAGHPHFQQQVYKTALYYPNETWLRYLLSDWKNQPAATKIDDTATTLVTNKSDELPQVLQANSYGQPEDENLISLPVEDVVTELPDFSDVHSEPEEAPLDEEELAAQELPLPLDESNQKIASILAEQAYAFHKPVDDNGSVSLETDPYHTVDYFESQGIALENKADETSFDTKVHKFTDWLRRMKRINPHPNDLGTDEEEENYVANIAATSNQTKDILTEPMAEILVKQGKWEKASEIYQKLSLLYPAKSAYFAARIEQIKP